MKCTNCGAALERSATFCGYCGTAVAKASVVAAAPVTGFGQPAFAAEAMVAAPALPVAGAADLPPYYQDAFAKIDAGGVGASKWNWAAFCFTALWYFYRGMWAKGLLMFVLSAFTGGAIWPLFWFYAGKCGNYDLWLLRKKGKQLW